MRSESEETARTEFDAFLRLHVPGVQLKWRDGDEPPDYYLGIEENEFAVEVTELVKNIPFGKRQPPMRIIARTLQRWVDGVECVARGAGVLDGTFVVCIPRAIPKLRQDSAAIIAEIIEAIRHLRDASPGSKSEFRRVEGRRCSVLKVANEGSALLCGGPTDSAWRIDSTKTLESLITERLTVKLAKLKNVANPVVLLLDDRFPFSDTAMYEEADVA